MKCCVLLLLVVVGGCATLGRSEQPGADDILEQAEMALERQDYREAYDQVSWLYRNYWSTPIGERALLTMVAIELDPRNPGRRLDAGAVLAGQHMNLPSASPWTIPVSETLYRLANEVREANERLDVLEDELEIAQRERVAALTEASREAAAARAARADAADARAEAARALRLVRRPPAEASTNGDARPESRNGEDLAAEVERLRARLADRDEELERIRETLVPPDRPR